MKRIEAVWNPDDGSSSVLWDDGRQSRYEVVGSEPYVTKAGESTRLRVWRSLCVFCGSEFLTKTSMKVTEPDTAFSRRACNEHKAKVFGAA